MSEVVIAKADMTAARVVHWVFGLGNAGRIVLIKGCGAGLGKSELIEECSEIYGVFGEAECGLHFGFGWGEGWDVLAF